MSGGTGVGLNDAREQLEACKQESVRLERRIAALEAENSGLREALAERAADD